MGRTHWIFTVVLIALLLFWGLIKGEETLPDDEQANLEKKIDRLIKKLGADDWKTREAATEELKKIGRPAIPALKQASESDDPEVAWRARIILRAIERKEKNSEPQKDSIKIWPKLQDFSNKFQIIIQGNGPYQSFSFRRDPSGRITVTITKKDKEGKEVTETYSADSIEEFQKKYPEIAKQFGIEEKKELEIPEIELEKIWEDFDLFWDKRWQDILKELQELKKRLEEKFKDEDWDDLFPIIPLRPRPSKNKLGITVEFVDEILRKHLNLPEDTGILIKEVTPGSLGEKIGFQKGDIILKVNDRPIKTIWEFKHIMEEALKKEIMKLSIIRKGELQILEYSKEK